jgi:peptidoglycan/LPS O-acetylase OafA/YrhL
MRPPKRVSERRVPELDGLRGIAILAIVIFHYAYAFPHDVPSRTLRSVLNFAPVLTLSMDLFFVLSGFLIGGILIRSRQSPRYFSTFYIRRFYRIFPAFYLFLFIYLLTAWIGSHFFHWVGVVPTKLAMASYLLYFPNWIGGDRLISWPCLSMSWSLGVEEQFYLIVPFLVRYLSLKRLTTFLVSLLIAAPCFRLALFLFSPGTFLWSSYALTPSRADQLAFGILAAIIVQNARAGSWCRAHLNRIYGLLILFLILNCLELLPLLVRADPLDYGLIGHTTFAAFFFLLILALFYHPQGKLAACFRVTWLRKIGQISYCMYLIHAAVDIACHHLLRHSSPEISDWDGLCATAVSFALVVLIASFSWRYFEEPLIRRGRNYQHKSLCASEVPREQLA